MKKCWALWIAALLLAVSCNAYALTAGDLGDDVLAYQNALLTQGYLEGTADGQYGEKTRQATSRLRAFASSQGLTFSGDESDAPDELVQALLSGAISPVTTTARLGDTSEATLRVQRRLRTLGYLADKADGYFGENTARAVGVFQYFVSLPVSGEADADTQARLFSADALRPERTILTKGNRNKRVLELQKRLTLFGFFTGDEDGQYGAETVEGVKALENYIARNAAFGALDAFLRGAQPRGIADPLLLELLFSDSFPAVPAAMRMNDEGQDVYRLQRRLIALGYLTEKPDGGYGEDTGKAVSAFQKRADVAQSGTADQATLERLFSDSAPESQKPYKLVVSLSEQSVTVYALNKKGEYAKRAAHFSCSTGTTETGTYKNLTRPLAKWVSMDGGAYVVKYAFQLTSGLMIHSIPYDKKDGTPDRTFLNALGQPASTKHIILAEENARLIYSKCPAKTPVEIVA